jgi:hypothetical protein
VIRTLVGFIYGSISAEFKSAYGVSESVTRLRAATRRFAFGVLAEQAAAGTVSESSVRLQRVIPMVGNSFKPFFIGRFETRSDGVYLTGRFTILGVVKAFMTLWLGCTLAMGIAFSSATINPHSGDWLRALGGSFGMFCAGLALVGFGKWLARNDVTWLSNVIRTALGGAPVIAHASETLALVPSGADSASSVPTVLRVTAVVLIFMGVMGIWSAYSGVSSWHATTGHPTIITRFSSTTLRLASGVYGFWALGTAFGVYRRQQWAWRAGLAYFGAAGLFCILQAFTSANFSDSAAVRVIFCVASLAVTLYWGWWWYAQRVHFSSDDDSLLKKQSWS